MEVGGVGGGLVAGGKTGSEFSEDDEGEVDLAGGANDGDAGGVSAHEVAVGVGIEGDVHFQSSGSTRLKSATALSKAGSSFQEPMRLSRSANSTGVGERSRPRARASTATVLRLLDSCLARRRRAASRVLGMARRVYCRLMMQAM